jgi:hypothetical protein
LAELVRQSLPKIDCGEFDEAPLVAQPSDEPPTIDGEEASRRPGIPNLYMLHVVADLIIRKVAQAAKDRRYNTVLVLSFLSAFVHTTVIFALENWALYKISPGSFSGANEAGFLLFLAYSLGQVATANLTTIQPLSSAATLLATVEVFCGVVILVIAVFSILTAARDTYRQDLEDFSEALHDVATAVDKRIQARYSLTAVQLEISLTVNSASTVNMLRRWRGLPELPGEDGQSTPPNLV